MKVRCETCGQMVRDVDFHGECLMCCIAGMRPMIYIGFFVLLAVGLALSL